MRMRRKKHRNERLASCSEYIISDILPYRKDIKSIFGNDKPLHIEIGCGKGKFISELASANPQINYIAIEKNPDVLVLAAEKIRDAGLENVVFFLSDANILNDFDTATKCERIYINFCDPWRKTPYQKRRLTHANYLAVYEKILSSDGEIHFKTDNAKLFEFSLNSLADYGLRLRNITFDLHSSSFIGNIMTEYEMLFSENGQPIYRCEAIFNK